MSHRKRLAGDEPLLSGSSKRHDRRSLTPRRRPSFPSHHEVPNLSVKIRRLCDLLATSSAIEESLDKAGIQISSEDVEEVLKLSYSHPATAVKFFRWAGPLLHHRHSPYSWNLIVDLLGKNSLFDAMWDAIRSMHSEGLLSLATFASVFSSFAAARRPTDALAAFDVLESYGVRQDTTALNSLLSALSREGFTDAASDFLRRISLRIPPDADSYAILLEGLENERDSRSAREVFDEMIVRIGWEPMNIPAYDSFLNTLLYHSSGKLDEALRWLHKMKGQNCFPGMKFLRNAINECVKLRDSRAAILLWDSLVGKNGLQPDTRIYNSMISLYCHRNQLDVAFQFLDEMVLHGAFPDSDTYNLMLHYVIKNKNLQELSALFIEMVKNELPPSPANCESTMKLLLDSKEWDMAINLWKIMITNGLAGEEIANSLIMKFCDYDRLPEACKYAEDVIDRGIKLSSATLSKLKTILYKLGKGYIYESLFSKWKLVSKDRSIYNHHG
ncbi:Pentatricopeptide repeat-containing protein [Apostasia shenzhenica]|uniref:Pentatricopeptide repeat-containing protein n=1 Tax=Apostasia shenzhenica TaxID=1088818 RepID=A0A2I0A174_9ASPA|nr:Pentatricopeptide repeat-containing protein [Apostasia shenzhenica]